MNIKNTVNKEEIDKFSKLADEWWDPSGKFAPLHKFNPIRQEYIINEISKNFDINIDNPNSLEKLKILDVGCGGGLLCEPLARLGAKVTGIDASKKNIVCMEVVEHVEDLDFFYKSCSKLLKKNGIIFFATINKTVKSYFLAILGAEYVLRWLPIGTHDWKKFVKPSHMINSLSQIGLSHEDIIGVIFNPLINKWKLSKDLDVNYMSYFKRN
jgi:2-polyprenyl-6-hydroxyphenyl methylase/3-demethylubiquinone-9 3-methyltransferase